MFAHRTRVSAAVVVGLATLMAPVLADGIVHADPISDQRAYVQSITDQLEELERQSDTLAEDYAQAVDELAGLEDEVAAAEAAVAAKQAEVDKLQGDLSEVAVQAFMGGTSNNALGPLLGDASSFNEDMQRDELTRVALNAGTTDSDDLSRALSELADEQQALQDQRDAAEEKKQEVADARAATEAKTKEYRDTRAAAEAKLGNLIQQEEERRARESYLRMQAQAAAAQQRAEAAAQQQAQNQQSTQSANPATGGNNTTASSGGNATASSGNGGGGNAPAPVAARSPSIPAASSRAGTAVNAAMSQIGVPYRFAAASPGVAFDCSGLTSWAWGRAGVGLPHQSRQQYASVPHVPASAAQPGDLLFFYSPISHVAIYLGNGMMIHAPNSGATVTTQAVNWGSVVGVGRPG